METTKKYKLTNRSMTYKGEELYQIQALKDFSDVRKGDLGGYIQSEKNLSQKANCWIYNTAKVLNNACVRDCSKVSGDSVVCDFADISNNGIVFGMAHICDDVQVYNNGIVGGHARISGDVKIYNNGQVFGQARISGNVRVYNNGQVFDVARISGDVVVCGTKKVGGNSSPHNLDNNSSPHNRDNNFIPPFRHNRDNDCDWDWDDIFTLVIIFGTLAALVIFAIVGMVCLVS